MKSTSWVTLNTPSEVTIDQTATEFQHTLSTSDTQLLQVKYTLTSFSHLASIETFAEQVLFNVYKITNGCDSLGAMSYLGFGAQSITLDHTSPVTLTDVQPSFELNGSMIMEGGTCFTDARYV